MQVCTVQLVSELLYCTEFTGYCYITHNTYCTVFAVCVYHVFLTICTVSNLSFDVYYHVDTRFSCLLLIKLLTLCVL